MAAEVITSPATLPTPMFDSDESESYSDASHAVVVMEDDPRTEVYIVEALRTMGLKPRTVGSADEALALARNENARCFILDISMGDEERAQEGLEALTRLKRHDKSISVAVYSNHPGLLRKASRQADVTHPKSGDHLCDIVNILAQLAAPHFRGLVGKIWDMLGHSSEPPHTPRPRQPREADINKLKYRELRADGEWLKNHLGRFVAFVDGELKDADTDRQKLLGRVRKEHSGRRIFLTEVKEREESVRIFSPLRLHHS